MPRRPSPRLGALLACATLALILAPCGEDEDEAASTTEQVASNECGQADVELPEAKQVEPPKRSLERGADVTAAVETNLGAFEIELDTNRWPKTSSSFVHLAEAGFYDGTTFHRVVADFLVQGGDPLGTGMGGPGYCIDEPPSPNTTYREGAVVMAKSASEPPGRSGSQFFVVTAADSGLPPDYAILGDVTDGEKTIDAIEDLADPTLGAAGGEPTEPVTIETVTVSR